MALPRLPSASSLILHERAKARKTSRNGNGSRVLFAPADGAPSRTLLARLGMVLMLLAAVILLLWLGRAGLWDQLAGEVSFGDIVYFSIITVTIVGYGDIVPSRRGLA